MVDKFSTLYLQRGQSVSDSARLRGRLNALFNQVAERYADVFRRRFEIETGTSIRWQHGRWQFEEMWRSAEIRDVLDAVTVMYKVIADAEHLTPANMRSGSIANEWVAEVGRAMREENVGYTVDKNGVVHFFVDQEFEKNRVSALAGLTGSRLGAVNAAFLDAYRHLDATPPDTKAAVRSMFEALETMSKLIVPSADRLTKNLCNQKLKEAALGAVGGDEVQQEALGQMFASLGYWVEGVHQYRHGQRAEEPVAPDVRTAVLILSSGASHLRHLVQIEQQLRSS